MDNYNRRYFNVINLLMDNNIKYKVVYDTNNRYTLKHKIKVPSMSDEHGALYDLETLELLLKLKLLEI